MADYKTKLTNIGLAKLTNAQLTSSKIEITHLAVGDANGNPYIPVPTATALVNEVWRSEVNRVEIDNTNPNWIVIEIAIPANEGGFMIREAGIFDIQGDLIAIANYPETYKPTISSGASKDLVIKMIIEVNNPSAVTMQIDPSVVTASRSFVQDQIRPVVAQLEDKISKGTVTKSDLDKSKDVNKWDINDFNESSRQAILEANDIDINYVLGEDAIVNENVTNRAITLSKLSEEIINDISDYTPYSGYTLLEGWIRDNGALYASSGYQYTELDCNDTTRVKITTSFPLHPEVPAVVFKDSSGSVISYVSGETVYVNHEVTIPLNATKMYINKTLTEPLRIQLYKPVVKDTFEDILNKVESLNKFKKTFSIDLTDATTVISNSNERNLSHSHTPIIKLAFNNAETDSLVNGIVIPIENLSGVAFVGFAIKDDNNLEYHYLKYFSGDLEILFDRTYNLKNNVVISFGYLNENLQGVSLNAIQSASDVTDANVASIRYFSRDASFDGTLENAGMSTSSTWKSIPYRFVQASEDELTYQDINSRQNKELIDEIFEEYLTQKSSVLMPSSLKMVSGSVYYLYPTSIVKNVRDYKQFGNTLNLTNGTYFEDTFARLTAPIASTTISIRDKFGRTVNAKEIAVHTKTKTVINKNVLVIGDSFIANKYGEGVGGYMKQMASADGNVLNFLGTRETYAGFHSEAVGGWSETTHHTNPDSRFVFDGVFNFARYLTTYNIPTPDVVVFFLGMNGGDGSRIKLMIDNIKSTHPNIKFIVCSIPGFFEYRANVNIHSGETSRNNQNQNYLNLFDNKESENILLCPTHMSWHRTLHYIHTPTNVLQFDLSNDNVTIPVCTDHHPTPGGAKSLAYMIYNYILFASL